MNLILFISYFLFAQIDCAKILGVFPAPGYSQFLVGEVLMKELANRGHEVTVISPHSPKNPPPNYRTILMEEVIEGTKGDLYELAYESLLSNMYKIYFYGNAITEFTLKNEGVQKLIHSNEEFDLVIIEQFYNDALKGFAQHFNAPLVLFTSMGITEFNKGYIGNPMLPSINAVTFSSFTNHMRFFQRIKNVAATIFDYMNRKFFVDTVQKQYLKKYFPKPMDYDKIVNNASLMLINSHVTTSENVLLNYNMIEIAGFHIRHEPLEKDVKTYLDRATDGAILFSLGSNLNTSDLSESTLKALFNVFGKLKQKVLWKFEKDLPNKPENIFISKWFKQKDILAHKNIHLFITHGGLLSTIEAIYHGVPMVGIPVFGDQNMNMARAKSIGIAELIPFPKLSEERLFLAVNETLNNPSYRENVKKISALMRDRRQPPLEEAMFWIEYVIRHKGAHFESASSKLYWFEMYMVDIWFFVLLNIFIVYLLVKSAVTLIRNFICKSEKKTKQKRQ